MGVTFVGKDTGHTVWLVVRFPNGDWSGGGSAADPYYDGCEKYEAMANTFEAAKKKCQQWRSRQVKKGHLTP